MKHLTDYQIQELISEENRLRKVFYADHLSLCSHCRERLAEYKKLFSRLEYADDIQIAPDFAKKVLAKAKTLKAKSFDYSKLTYLLPFPICALILAALEVFGVVDLAPIFQIGSSSIVSIFSTVSLDLLAWLPSLNISFQLIVVGATAMGLFHLLDLLLIKPRFK